MCDRKAGTALGWLTISMLLLTLLVVPLHLPETLSLFGRQLPWLDRGRQSKRACHRRARYTSRDS